MPIIVITGITATIGMTIAKLSMTSCTEFQRSSDAGIRHSTESPGKQSIREIHLHPKPVNPKPLGLRRPRMGPKTNPGPEIISPLQTEPETLDSEPRIPVCMQSHLQVYMPSV